MATPVHPKDSPAVIEKKNLDHLYERMGGKDHLSEILGSSSDPRVVNLLQKMFNPECAKFKFSHLCKTCDLSLRDMMDIFREFKFVETMVEIFREVPEVAKDVATDARSKWVFCKRCDGTKQVPREDADGNTVWEDCPSCDGKGRVREAGDKQARSLIFDATGLTSKKGPMVNINQNFGTNTGRLEDLTRVTQDEGDIIDV